MRASHCSARRQRSAQPRSAREGAGSPSPLAVGLGSENGRGGRNSPHRGSSVRTPSHLPSRQAVRRAHVVAFPETEQVRSRWWAPPVLGRGQPSRVHRSGRCHPKCRSPAARANADRIACSCTPTTDLARRARSESRPSGGLRTMRHSRFPRHTRHVAGKETVAGVEVSHQFCLETILLKRA